MDTLPDKNNHDSTHMTAFSGTQSSTGQTDTGSNKWRTHSLDSGVYVNMEINFDESLKSTELEETNDVKDNHQNDSPTISPQPEVQHNDGTALGSKGSTSSVIPEVDNTKALRPSSILRPPPLPPKQNRKPPGFKKSSSQGAEFKVSNEENKPLNSLIRQTSPVPGGDKDDNQRSDLITGKIPNIHNSCTFGILPKVAAKCSPQPSLKCPHKPPKKPPRLNKPNQRAEVEEQQQRRKPEVEWSKQEDKMGDKRSRHEQYPTDRNEKMKENTEASGTESHLGVAKPSRQILVIFTDMKKSGEEDEDPNNIVLTSLNMAEKSSLLPQDEKPNRKCTSEDSTKPALPPAKPHIKCCPVPPIKPPQLFSVMKAGIEEEKERRKQEEEQWRHEDTLDKGREDYEEEGNDRGNINEDPSDTKLTSPALTKMSPQIEELARGGQRFCLMPCCRNSQKPENTPKNQTLHLQSQLPGTQHQNTANGQFNPVPLLREVPAQVNPMETDLNIETLKWTENKDIQISGQVIFKMSSGRPQDTEVFMTELDPCQLGLKRLENAQEIGETLLDGDLKQTNQKPRVRLKVKNLAKKVMCKFKEGREEKRRIKAGEVEMEDTELTQEAKKEEEMKEEDEELRGRDEDGVGQLAVTEKLERIKRRHPTPESPFSSFKVYSPVKLVAELLSGVEWSQFLYTEQSSTADSPPDQTQAEDRAQHCVNFQLSSSAELDVSTDMFKGNPADPEGESIYENIDLLNVNAEEQQEMDRTLGTAMPQILVESDTILMSPRTKDIYDTVEFIQPVQPANTYFNFSEIKSQAVLDSSVQKYLIKLSKKRKRKVWKKRWDRSHAGTLSQSPSTSSQLFTASIFYNVPAAGVENEQQSSTVKIGGHSPRIVAKIKAALIEKTLMRAAEPKEDRRK